MITRILENRLRYLANNFKSVVINGPRQSGKTTLVKMVFKDKPYVSLENPDTRLFAKEDPRGFLQTYKTGAIFDEIQRVPELFSYIQEILDNTKEKGLFILTGSNNFLLQESISQSLAGRIASVSLLPFSISELNNFNLLPENDIDLMLKGFYPPVYDQKIPYTEWYPNYISTYVEKDVRQLKNIKDLYIFEKFLSILAGRCSQELNLTSISNDVGVDVKTIQSWIGVLESSYIVYLLKPYYKNFNKTIVKRPKLYFYDTAIVSSLLGITRKEHIATHPLKGVLFENMIVSEILKKHKHLGLQSNMFYWRDKTGHEIDLILDNKDKLLAIEIKSAQTVNNDFFKNIKYWKKISKENNALLLYAGKQKQIRSDNTLIMNWRDFVFNFESH